MSAPDFTDAQMFEAARICRDEYCRRAPGKRTWDDLSYDERDLDVACLRAAIRYLNGALQP